MNRKGFTLIELLVVIAIIGLLSSVVFASLNSARGKARNAKRLADLQEIQKALEFYYDANGAYPYRWGWMGTTPGCYGNNLGNPDDAIPGLVPTYISSLPRDPLPNLGNGYCYLYISNGVDYKLLAYGTVEGGAVAQGAPGARYPTGCGASETSYGLYTPGFRCY